jgi:hypothetical protein
MTEREYEVLPELVEEGEVPVSFAGSKLHPSDDSLLTFLHRFGSKVGKDMIGAIRKRKLYQRIAVLSGARDPATYKELYNKFRLYRSKRLFSALETERKEWQEKVVETILRRVRRDPHLLPAGLDCAFVEQTIKDVEPLILVDVPTKATNRAGTYIRFLREDHAGIHGRSGEFQPRFASFRVEKDETDFDIEVGKIRVLAHPSWRSLLIRCIKDRETFRVIRGETLSDSDDDEFFARVP